MDTDKKDAWARVAGKGVYPVEYAGWLLTPWHRLTAPPSKIVRRLGLQPTDRVLEIGCGPGYFSPSVARFAAGISASSIFRTRCSTSPKPG